MRKHFLIIIQSCYKWLTVVHWNCLFTFLGTDGQQGSGLQLAWEKSYQKSAKTDCKSFSHENSLEMVTSLYSRYNWNEKKFSPKMDKQSWQESWLWVGHAWHCFVKYHYLTIPSFSRSFSCVSNNEFSSIFAEGQNLQHQAQTLTIKGMIYDIWYWLPSWTLRFGYLADNAQFSRFAVGPRMFQIIAQISPLLSQIKEAVSLIFGVTMDSHIFYLTYLFQWNRIMVYGTGFQLEKDG